MKNRIERIETIKARVEATKKRPGSPTHKLKFRDDSHFLPVIKMETEYLAFRLENSRTQRQQKGYLRMYPELPENFFEDPESSRAQKVQEEILLKMVVSHRDFLKDLGQYGQDEPAIITYDGFIVNGNRRTAGLKKLGTDYIECAVLPEDVNAKEIFQVEQDLQIAEDFKQDYDWVNELLHIRAGKEDERYKLTDKQLIKNLRISAQELRSRFFRLDLIDGFLGWKKIPYQYDYPKLDDAKQAFQELEKGLKTKWSTDIIKQKLLKQHIYLLIENRPDEGRLYDHVRDIIKNFNEILITLSKDKNKEKEIEEPKDDTTVEDIVRVKDNKPEKDREDELKNNEADEYSDEQRPGEIEPDDSDEAKKLIEIKDDIKAKNKEKKNKEVIYNSVSVALRSLSGLSISDESTKLTESRNKLQELLRIANDLLLEIENKLKGN